MLKRNGPESGADLPCALFILVDSAGRTVIRPHGGGLVMAKFRQNPRCGREERRRGLIGRRAESDRSKKEEGEERVEIQGSLNLVQEKKHPPGFRMEP